MDQWESEPVVYGFGPEQLWYQRRGLVLGIIAGVAGLALLVVTLVLGGGSGGDANGEEPGPITFPTVVTGDPVTTTSVATDTTVPGATTLPPATTTTEPVATTTDPAATTTTVLVGELTVWDLLQTRAGLSRVAELLVIAELDDVLRGADPFTFFAPTNEALADFEATAAGAAIIGNQGRLTTFLLRHLAFPRALTTAQIYDEGFVLVATGEFLEADRAAGTLDGVLFLLADDAAGNGVLHVMDDVVAP